MISLCYTINFDPTWAYNKNTVLDNMNFNVVCLAILLMILVSLILSFNPDSSVIRKKVFSCFFRNIG